MNLPLRDLEKEHPIPDDWRDTISQVVTQLCNGNFELANSAENISLRSTDLAHINKQNVLDYVSKLTPLLGSSWDRSCCQWMGEHWDLITDLCTHEEGVSDLVLSARVYPLHSGFKFDFGLIYVP